MEEVEIRPTENGPYIVRGPIRIVGADGTAYDVADRPTVALCRCGGSASKPFCDGTHTEIGFGPAEQAVATAREQTG